MKKLQRIKQHQKNLVMERKYHGCLCPGCLYNGIQTTLYIRGSEESNRSWNKKLKRSEK